MRNLLAGAIVWHVFPCDPEAKRRPAAAWRVFENRAGRFADLCEVKRITDWMRVYRRRYLFVETPDRMRRAGFVKPASVCPEFRERVDLARFSSAVLGRLDDVDLQRLIELVRRDIRSPAPPATPDEIAAEMRQRSRARAPLRPRLAVSRIYDGASR